MIYHGHHLTIINQDSSATEEGTGSTDWVLEQIAYESVGHKLEIVVKVKER